MKKPVLLVIGASGDVGQGIVDVALSGGRTVVASARNTERLGRLAEKHASGLHLLGGDVSNEASANALMKAAADLAGPLDEVVVSVNAPAAPCPLAECDADGLQALFAANVLTHFHAARAAIAALGPGGKLIGIGGGMADLTFFGMTPVSMCQAALRSLYRGLAKEYRDGPLIQELMIASMVNGESKRESAQDSWVTDVEVGTHVCAVLDNPDQFEWPVSVLKSRKQVGKPDKDAG